MVKKILFEGSDNFFNNLIKRAHNILECKNHTPRRLLNKLLSVGARTLYPARPPCYPTTLMIEPTTACQLKCPLCPVGMGILERSTGHMQFETFRKIIDEMGRYIYSVNLNGSGEPLLNRELVPMIEYAKQKKLYIDVYTNLQLNNKQMLTSLVTSGLDRILFSMEGTTKEIYESYRIRGKFERIVENIHFLVDEKKRTGSSISLDLQFVVMRGNEHQLNEIAAFAESLGVDNLFVKSLFLFLEKDNDKRANQYIPKNKRLTMYAQDMEGIHWKGEKMKACKELWLSSVILRDGSVSPCCFDYNGKVIFGNIHEKPFKAIWNSKRYKAFRRRIIKRPDSIELCNSIEGGCPSLFFHPDNWLIRLDKETD